MSDCCSSFDANVQDREIHPLTVSLDRLDLSADATYSGGNISPSIIISNLEPQAVSIAVMVFNPFIKTCCSFTPWIIWNLAPTSRIARGIPSGLTVDYPVPAVQGMNDYGEIGYHGPQPPPGEMHRYQFRVYVLDSMLDLPGGSTKNDLIKAMVGHVLQYGETVGISTG